MRVSDDEITIGEILRPHGVRGRVRVFPTTDDPHRFEQLKIACIVQRDGLRQNLTIESVQVNERTVLLKFADVNSREQAEELRNARITISREQCLPLPANHFYIFDLVGLEVVTVNGISVGHIAEVLEYPASDIYVVRDQQREILIPAVAHIVKDISLEKRRVLIDPIDGLLPE